MITDLTNAIVRIINSYGNTVGTGFVLNDDGLIATCAHVIENAEAGPGDSVHLVFHHTGDEATAIVESDGWHAPEAEDIAILRLNGMLPAAIKTAILGTNDNTTGHSFRAFGYPKVDDIQGIWAEGKILGPITDSKGTTMLQLDSSQVAQGMSGGPVLNVNTNRVVGMITATYHADETLKLRDTAFAISSEVLLEVWPELPLASPPALNTAPRPPDYFVERLAEFDQLLTYLVAGITSEKTSAITTVLQGNGGFGKTVLAQAICCHPRIDTVFTDGILWVEMGQYPNLLGKLNDQMTLLSGINSDFKNVVPAAARLRELLTDRRILLVLDDVWGEADTHPFLPPKNSRAAMLITTRLQDVAVALTAQRVTVNEMQTIEAAELLTKGLPLPEISPSDRVALRDLAQYLGEWPLLMNLIRTELNELLEIEDYSLPEAIAEVRAALQEEGFVAFDREDKANRNRAIGISLEVSLKRLGNLRMRYLELAVFPEDEDIPFVAIERLWGISVTKTKRVLRKMQRLSLFNRYYPEKQTVRLHDVIRHYLMIEMRETLPALHLRLLNTYHRTLTGDGWHTVPDDGYLYDHLIYHLNQANLPTEIVALFDNGLWLKERYKSSMSMSTLLQDIQDAQLTLINHNDFNSTLELFLLEYRVLTFTSSGFAPFELALASLTGNWQLAFVKAKGLPDLDNRIMALACLASTAALKDIPLDLEIFRELDELIEKFSPNALARAAMFLVIADYERAFDWLVRVASDFQFKEIPRSSFRDRDNKFTVSLMLLRKYDLNLCAKACVHLDNLIFREYEPSEGIRYNDRLPVWFSTQLEILLLQVMARQDWCLVPLAVKAIGGKNDSLGESESYARRLANKFRAGLEQFNSVTTLEIVAEILNALEKYPEFLPGAELLLQQCINRLVTLQQRDLTNLISEYDNASWKDLLAKNIIYLDQKDDPKEIKNLLNVVSEEKLQLDLHLYFLNKKEPFALDLLRTLYERSLALSISMDDSSTFKECLQYKFDELIQDSSLYEALEQIWNKFSSLDKPNLRFTLFTWSLDRDFNYGFEKLCQENLSKELISTIRDWLTSNSLILQNQHNETLSAWILDQINRSDDEYILKDLHYALASMKPGLALTIFKKEIRGIREDDIQFFTTCGELAAKEGDLETVEKAADLIKNRVMQSERHYLLKNFLVKIYDPQPEFVKTYVNQLSSKIFQCDCWIAIAQTYLPDNLHQAIRILGNAPLGYVSNFPNRTSGTMYFSRENMEELIIELLHLDDFFNSWEIEDAEKVLRQLEQIEFSTDSFDIALDLLLNSVVAEPKAIHSLYNRFAKTDKFFVRLQRPDVVDPAYVELLLEDNPEAFLAQLYAKANNYMIDKVFEISFWYLLVAGKAEIAEKALSTWTFYRRTEHNPIPFYQETVTSLLPALRTRDNLDLMHISRILNKINFPHQAILGFIKSYLKAVAEPLTETHIEIANYELQHRKGKQRSEVLKVLAKRVFANEIVAEQLWDGLPHDFLPWELIVKILEAMITTQSIKASGIVDYIVSNSKTDIIAEDFFKSNIIEIETKRKVLDLKESAFDYWLETGNLFNYYLFILSKAAIAILSNEELQQFIARIEPKILNLDDRRRDAMVRLSIVIARWNSHEALIWAERHLEDRDLSLALQFIAQKDPQLIIDYVLQNKRRIAGKNFIGQNSLYFSPFLDALREANLSVEELTDLRSRLLIISSFGDGEIIEKLIVQKLLNSDKLNDAINFVEKEFIRGLPIIISALLNLNRWNDIERLLAKLCDKSNCDEALSQITLKLAETDPKKTLQYLEMIERQETRIKVLIELIGISTFVTEYPGGKTGLLTELLDTMYLNIGGRKEIMGRHSDALDVVIDALSPANSAKLLMDHKQAFSSNLKRIMLWAEKAHSTRPTEEVINVSVQAAEKVDRMISEVFSTA